MATTTAEHAKEIRATLKAELGATSKDVSVRTSNYSMGSSISVVIRSPKFRLADVERIANRHERVSRDSTGEILSGGNRFVFVEYSDEAYGPMAVEILAAIQSIGAGPSSEASYRGVSIYRYGSHRNVWSASGPGVPASLACMNGSEFAARQIAVAILDGAGACTKHDDCREHVELGIECAQNEAAQ